MFQQYSKLRQSSKVPTSCTTDNNENWGHWMEQKPDNCIRLVMENVNSIQASSTNNIKLHHGKTWLIENDVDVACWIELGVPWHRHRQKYCLPQIMKASSWKSQIAIAANNIHEFNGKQQFGGTATMLFNGITLAVAGPCYDASGLGCWTWVRLQGRGSCTTTIITAYNPCKSSSERPNTVYMQHKRYGLSRLWAICRRSL